MRSRRSLRNSRTMSRPPFWMDRCRNETLRNRAVAEAEGLLPTHNGTDNLGETRAPSTFLKQLMDKTSLSSKPLAQARTKNQEVPTEWETPHTQNERRGSHLARQSASTTRHYERTNETLGKLRCTASRPPTTRRKDETSRTPNGADPLGF